MGQLMVNLGAILGILLYFGLGFCYFNEWLDLFQLDAGMTKKQRQISVIVLLGGTLLWPALVPFAYLELLKSQKKRAMIEIMFNHPNPKPLD